MRITYLIFFICASALTKGQIHRDYVVNGSFEELYNCAPPSILSKAKNWSSIDSQSVAGLINNFCNNRVPKSVGTWQFPRKGSSYVINTIYCPNFSARGYMRNRMRATLLANHTYCVRFFLNIANTSPRGIDGFGAYCGDATLDTITKCNVPLTYFIPQVSNPLGYVISDTLNWVPITGTFVATGSEKYMVIGNFLSDNAVTTSTINGPFVNEEWTDACFDDVSCFDIDMPAYAGPDRACIIGDSTFIGSDDPGLDEFCTWYQLPNSSTPIATVSGMYVKPVQTSTYVVRQQLWCSGVRWDTVMIYQDALGIHDLRFWTENLVVTPQPASEMVSFRLEGQDLSKIFDHYQLSNELGQVVQAGKINPGSTELQITLGTLPAGTYAVVLSSENRDLVLRRKVVLVRE